MRTYLLLDTHGDTFAFEVGNAFISAATIARILRSTLNAEVTSGPNGIFSRDDVRLRFTVQGVPFQVWEPFGDNSRYWIGPDSPKSQRHPLIDSIHDVLRAYDPNPITRMLSSFGRKHAA